MESGPIYQLRPAEVFRALETSQAGLSSEDVPARQELFGPNILTEEVRQPLWRELLEHIFYPMALLLWGVALVAIALGQILLGIAIFVLVIVNGAFSFWRNYRAEQAMVALRRLLPEYSRVLRDDVEVNIPSREIVPGDVLVLAEGDHIPADARVVEEYGLRTNNSTLTGDAVPERNTADASFREGISEVERPNLVFAGTSVVSGTGRAVVYATGMLSQFGRIAHLTQVVKEKPSPIQVELNQVTRKITLAAFAIGVFVLAVGIFDAQVELETFEAFILALGIIVAAVPEGLPATLTLSLAMAGQRLAQKGVLVKKLSVLETLGTASVICTDKSGTLTQNQMTVREVWVAGQRLAVSGVGYEPRGKYSPNPAGQPYEADLQALLTTIMLCNNARLSPPTPSKPKWTSLGDQTEAAMRVAALKGKIDEDKLSRNLPRVHELPFDARRKRMATIHQVVWSAETPWVNPPDNHTSGAHARNKIALVKGAPREILQLCNQILIGGQPQALDKGRRNEILAVIDDYAGRALRVLAVAQRLLPNQSRAYEPEWVERDLTFLGLVAMHDPPRPEVTEAIQVCKEAGIRMVMITGDYGLTALSLARRVGMVTGENARIITGAEVDALDEIELQTLITQEREVLFSRMAPEHKLRLVSCFQSIDEVVAVTGDGVNDAPALRKADVGVSMGISGTDVSREAADIILVNDNFAAVVEAIREGRALYDNLRKFMTYILSSNVPEILPFLLTALTKIPLALGLFQILAIDLGTDLLPALGLGSEKPEPDVMKHPPRRRTQAIVDTRLVHRALLWLGMIEATLCYSGFVLVYFLADKMYLLSGRLSFIHPPALSWFGLGAFFTGMDEMDVYALGITTFYAGVVIAQIGNAFACRAEINRSTWLGWLSNRLLIIGVLVSLGLLLVLIYFPPAAQLLDHHPLPLVFWGWLLWYGLVIYALEWIRKAVVRQTQRNGNKSY
jgi:Ca2+-transporting ATPase